MSRTAGAVSLVSVKWADLVARIPADYSGFVSIGKKWLDAFEQPTEETVCISKAELTRLRAGFAGDPEAQPLPQSPHVGPPNPNARRPSMLDDGDLPEV